MTDKDIETRLRRLAKGSGFNFKRSTAGKGDQNRGGFQLFEMKTNAVVAGIRYELELRDVAIQLQRIGILGYGGAL